MTIRSPAWLLYDADCGWCRFSVGVVLRLDRDRRLHPVAIQSEAGQALLAALPAAERLASAHAIGPDGVIRSGGDAAPLVAERLALLVAAAPALRRFPRAARAAYRFVAGRRRALGRLVPDRAASWARRVIAANDP